MNFEDLENIEIDGVDSKDYPDFCDAYIAYAECNGIPLTDYQLKQAAEDYPSKVSEIAYKSLMS